MEHKRKTDLVSLRAMIRQHKRWDMLFGVLGLAALSVGILTLVALAWWAWADASGMTKRREMARDAERKADRRKRNISALGLGPDQRSSTFRRR